MSSPFSRSLPPRPNLDQQKTQAKELLLSFVEGDVEATARVRAVLPDKSPITLADAQFVLAREYGFPNWASLKERIEAAREDDETVTERWRAAINRRDARAARRLLEQHPQLRDQIDAPTFDFDSPAIVACATDLAMVEVLLEFGADPNRRSDWWAGGFHPLYSATGPAADRLIAAGATIDACAAAHLDRPDTLTKLIAEDPARVHQRGGDGQTPLHFARSRAVVDILLGAGADIDARDVDHRSTAAEWMLDRRRGAGRYDLARYLVERGAAADIFLAAALGLTDRARAMLEADPSLLDLRTSQGAYGEQPPSSYHTYMWTIGDSRSPLDVARQFEQADTVNAMRSFATPLQQLLFACASGDEASARAVVRAHPGIVASMAPVYHRTLADAAWNGNAHAVGLMLDLGFDPRTTGPDSGTLLHLAAWQGSAETVELLLRHQEVRELLAVRDARHGGTPLGWCCHGSVHGDARHDHAGVARLLVAAGAPLGPDTAGGSPAVRAAIASASGASPG